MPTIRRQGIMSRSKAKFPKRKKARFNTPPSCEIEYFIETTFTYSSGRSAFFTDDALLCAARIHRAGGWPA
jgi:hypothetical protein